MKIFFSPNRFASLALLSLAACSSAKNSSSDKTKVGAHGLTNDQARAALFTVDDRSVTVGDFAQSIAQLSPYLKARYQSPERRRELLDNMIQFELLAAEARTRGLDKRPEIQELHNRLMVDKMLEDEIRKNVRMEDVTQSEIEGYYKAHPEEFHKPAQVRIAHILVKDKAAAAKVLAEALKIPREDHESFDALVAKYSEDAASKAKQGDINYVAKPEAKATDPFGPFHVQPEVANAAFDIPQIGEFYPRLVHTAAGYHVVRLIGKRNAIDLSLGDAQRIIQQRVWNEKREAWIKSFVETLKKKNPNT